MEYPIKKDSNGMLTEECNVNAGVKIGSYDCTANCPFNENTKKEIQEHAFELPFVRCKKINNNNQLKIEL